MWLYISLRICLDCASCPVFPSCLLWPWDLWRARNFREYLWVCPMFFSWLDWRFAFLEACIFNEPLGDSNLSSEDQTTFPGPFQWPSYPSLPYTAKKLSAHNPHSLIHHSLSHLWQLGFCHHRPKKPVTSKRCFLGLFLTFWVIPHRWPLAES